MSRSWDDRWQRYPASKPLPTEGGVATSKRRGPMAETWWSARFVAVLESYGLGARMQRGRRYARAGQILTLDVRTAVIVAQVQGSRRQPYLVTLSLPEPSRAQWGTIAAAMASKVGFAARLLAGEVPPELEDVFERARVALFPRSWRDLRAECSCPDWENPCKHIAAVLYVFADQLDADPWLLLQWRGRNRDEILEPLRGAVTPASPADEVAPWWPFAPGELPAFSEAAPATSAVEPVDPEHPDTVLDRMEPLDVVIGGAPFREVVRPVYEQLAAIEMVDDSSD